MSIRVASPALNTSEADYLQMIQRFDQLWAVGQAEHEQAEMQSLLQQIEHYEEQHRDYDGASGNKARP
jgi:hypothetical protein